MTDAEITTVYDGEQGVQTQEPQHDTNKIALDAAIDATNQNPSLDDFTAAKVQAAASFKLDEPRGHHLFWIAQNGKHLDLIDARCQKLSVRDWIVYMKDVVRKDGSIDENGMVTCLFLDDGRSVSWASPTTNRQWCAVVRGKPKSRFDPPLDVAIVPNASDDKDKGPWYSILPWGAQATEDAIRAWKELR